MSPETNATVYVLSNPAMPGLVKIGMTGLDDPKIRADQLYGTGVPVPFEIEFAGRVSDAAAVERALHEAFDPQRVNPRREFFSIEPRQAIVILRLLQTEDVTESAAAEAEKSINPTDREAGARMKQRRPNFNFEEMGIPAGSTLRSTRTDDTAEVTGPRQVRFRGEQVSASAATRIMMDADHSLNPGPYWTFDGRRLNDIYDETYGS